MSPLLSVLRDRQAVTNLDPESWSLLFAEARASALMPRLAAETCGQSPCLDPCGFEAADISGNASGRSLRG